MCYYILYTDAEEIDRWELVSGEDAMQQRVDELCRNLDCEEEEIHVFADINEIL